MTRAGTPQDVVFLVGVFCDVAVGGGAGVGGGGDAFRFRFRNDEKPVGGDL